MSHFPSVAWLEAQLGTEYVTSAQDTRHYLHATAGSGAGNQPVFLIGQDFTTVPLNTVDYDTAAGFNSATGIYTVPITGFYDVNAMLRVTDGQPTGRQLGIGVDTSNTDSATFAWYTTTASTRCSLLYATNRHLTAGSQIRLFTYVDDPGGLWFSSASLSLSLIGQG